jgi:UDP-glucose 4-epimerase
VNRPRHQRAPGDALARRHIAQWRRVTARLQVLLNSGNGAGALADEAHALRRQCERLALELAACRQRRGDAPPMGAAAAAPGKAACGRNTTRAMP